MPALLPAGPDVDGLLEYSVVYTDRALNHMSVSFQQVMRDLSASLKRTYNADAVAIVPGSGTYGMEAVARQFATTKHTVVIRNGWFSYRWTQILDQGGLAKSCTVLQARRATPGDTQPFAPAPIDEVVRTIKKERPAVVFAPHVETSAGIILPDSYISAMADAVHSVGGLMVLDCIASGCLWVDMKRLGVDALISAPQKGWTGPACCAMVMMSSNAVAACRSSQSSSFTLDLAQWLKVMEAYEGGKHMYHATMPTDALRAFRDVLREGEEYGLGKLKGQQQQLGEAVRSLLHGKYGFASVAADGFHAPGVVVCYTPNPTWKSGAAFAKEGMQIAAGVQLSLGEGANYSSFRIGLFGMDKLRDIKRTVGLLDKVLKSLSSAGGRARL
uniref:alanine--glyoxylate transaminase n=1 Tax=Hemiselmis andersenii TaxID=464988 RepID=A0A6U4S3M0_HEMAN|mmetsp:Transcript_12756/g.31254  ORF Transcript_12756/g.31254 Transcript_12756/m.31254 type:complete len:386 (+) Transcript_12756:136-1293(+)